MMHLHALPTCVPPYYETTVGSGVFTDTVGGSGRICNPCSPGERWSAAISDCVLDTNPSPPSPSGGGGSIDPNLLKYGIIALVGIALLGSFMGGRASKKTRSGLLLSRTTTRSVFG